MGFFKDFKEDFSEAVNELMPGTTETEATGTVTSTIKDEIDVNAELDKLDGLLEKASKRIEEEAIAEAAAPVSEPVAEEKIEPAPVEPKPIFAKKEIKKEVKEEIKMDETMNVAPVQEPVNERVASDENAVITKGMSIKGDLTSTGSIEIQGTIEGNVDCFGKLTVEGTILGNSQSAEFFADQAHVTGEVVTTGTAKIGLGSVIIGNISATSAVIAGAVKGDIDVHGPVVVDTSAVIMGNIKSKSVQINNGAVIEGFCSQTYADVDVDQIFG